MNSEKATQLRRKAAEIKALREAIARKSAGTKKQGEPRKTPNAPELPIANKIFGILIFSYILLPNLYFLFSRNFIPSVVVKETALILTSVFILITFLFFFYAKYTKRLTSPFFQNMRKTRLAVTLLFSPFLVFGTFWINTAIIIPKTVNDVIGSETREVTLVNKKSSTSRYGCSYSLTFIHKNSWLFDFCISEKSYNTFPDEPFYVTAIGIESLYGKTVNSVIPVTNPDGSLRLYFDHQ